MFFPPAGVAFVGADSTAPPHVSTAQSAAATAAAPVLPHVLFLLIDDFGWADASWHRAPGYTEVRTPNMEKLVRAGIELDRNCIPTWGSNCRLAALRLICYSYVPAPSRDRRL